MRDAIKTPADLAQAVRELREAQGLSIALLAQRSGHSRALIYRLESGGDVSSSSIFDVLRVLGASARITPAAMPTLEEMKERFKEPD